MFKFTKFYVSEPMGQSHHLNINTNTLSWILFLFQTLLKNKGYVTLFTYEYFQALPTEFFRTAEPADQSSQEKKEGTSATSGEKTDNQFKRKLLLSSATIIFMKIDLQIISYVTYNNY